MELASAISHIGVEGARWVEENLDEQYKALEYLSKSLPTDHLLRLVVLNAVVSYQLSGRGEAWWWEFSQYFSENPPEDLCSSYKRFLVSSKYNKRLINIKIRRIERFCPLVEEADLLPYYTRMSDLRNFIARALSTNPSSKTVVFSVKMFGYAARITSRTFIPYPMDVPIPLDLRIERLTRSITTERPHDFWNKIARKSGVPPLHIDSILWPILGNKDLIEPFLEKFGSRGEELLRLLKLR